MLGFLLSTLNELQLNKQTLLDFTKLSDFIVIAGQKGKI